MLGELWFSSARSFNDPFDVASTYTFGGVELPIAEEWVRKATDRHAPDWTSEQKDAYAAKLLGDMRNNPKQIEFMRKSAIEENLKKFGICSLSGNRDSLLMWAHYTAKHTGLCIGFKVARMWEVAELLAKQNELLELHEVKYAESMPDINMFEAMLKLDSQPDDGSVSQFIATKSSHWKYEDEFRLVFWGHPNSIIAFGPSLIAEVVLGCRMEESLKAEITKNCKATLPWVQVYYAQPDNEKFQLNLVLQD
jgi:hypothetical protein